ncbi:Indoleamine 2,3-dioxygenase [Peziza echinospora]|nr:Indoleamine 2,3-dioxygenase [Peziza echinospora]
MIPPIPNLEDYSISYTNGFLPDKMPLRRLPDRYYEAWEDIVDNLQALILTKRIRSAVNMLPILSHSRLHTEPELQRAYSILGFIAHAYIWGGDRPAQRLPACLSIPFLRVSERLEIIPVASYAGVALWNYRTLFGSIDIDDLRSLATLQTFSGSLDESWFYLVSVAIEARGAPVVPMMLDAIAAARRGDTHTVIAFLTSFAEILEELTGLLGRMYENCDPHVFYYKIRPFLAGSKNMVDAGLPHGVWYEDEDGKGMWRQFSGGSNAQSSLIQAFDIILGIEHRPTGTKKPEASDVPPQGITPPQKHNFIQEMRDYMPGPHRRFLERLTVVANIRPYVEARKDTDKALCDAFDSCLAMLRGFRDKHIQIVSRYIIIQAKAAKKNSSPATETAGAGEGTTRSSAHVGSSDKRLTSTTAPPQKANLASAEATKKGLTGTGGTALIPFLKQARDETGEPAIGPIAKRLFFGGAATKSLPATYGNNNNNSNSGTEFSADAPPPMVGLAGYWLESNDYGGLCSY